ncbi:MAG: glycosyltransferase [Balneolales bacterium]
MIGKFPVISETFVINQIAALLEQGYDIDIYATCKGKLTVVQPEVEKYGLLNKTRFKPGVPNNHLIRFLKAFKLFLTNKPDLKTIKQTLSINRLGRQALNLTFFYESVPFWNSQSYDVIICHFGPNGNRALMMRDSGLIKGPILTIFHGFDITHYVKMFGIEIYRPLFEKGDLFLTISELWKKKLLKAGVSSKRILVHRVGVETHKFSYNPPGPLQGKPVISVLSVGRLVEKKGFEYGIRAINQLCQSGYPIVYHIFGDGPLREPLRNLIKQMDLDDNIMMHGECTHEVVNKHLKKADLVLVPSVTATDGDMEGIPVILMEAMASGVPVVASRHSGIPELITNGYNGFLAEERDVSDIANMIEQVINSDDNNEILGRQARLTIEKSFDVVKLNRRLESILTHIGENPIPEQKFKVSKSRKKALTAKV